MQNKIAILLTTYNRYSNLIKILKNIKSNNFEIDVFIHDDFSSQNNVINNSKNYNLFYYKSKINNGKKNYYKTINYLFNIIKKNYEKENQYFLTILMQDDLDIPDDFVDECVYKWNIINKEIKNPVITYHSDILRKYYSCWDSGLPQNGELYDITNWCDCLFLTSPDNLSKINFKLSGKYAKNKNPNSSSGVGKELTELFRLNNIKLLRLNESLAFHNFEKSKMNNRKYFIQTFNYIKNIDKKIIISISSMNSRFENLINTLKSIDNQSDIINVYLNNYSEKNINYLFNNYKSVNFFPSQGIYGDLGDTGKFLFQNKKDYYLTCDDDIIYPEFYSKKIIENINKYNSIVGFHGSLISSDEEYYSRKIKFHFNKELIHDKEVNILGTGVMGFDNSKYFFPFNTIKTKNMSDIYIAEYANNNNYKFICLSKNNGWIKPQNVSESIYDSSNKKDNSILDNSNFINKIIKNTKWKNLK
jgi:hypothetical protein